MKSQKSAIAIPTPTPAPAPARKTRSDGERSRGAILLAATRLATTRGLTGMSIGDLADHIGMSKSGLYAHFKSKEELELATIETAVDIFTREVTERVRSAPRDGTARLLTLCDAFCSHLERHVFPGGCFFAAAAAELDTRPGRARDRVFAFQTEWVGLIAQCIREARDAGEIDRRADVEQAVFEVLAMLNMANSAYVMTSDRAHLERARRGIENVMGGMRKTKGHR